MGLCGVCGVGEFGERIWSVGLCGVCGVCGSSVVVVVIVVGPIHTASMPFPNHLPNGSFGLVVVMSCEDVDVDCACSKPLSHSFFQRFLF